MEEKEEFKARRFTTKTLAVGQDTLNNGDRYQIRWATLVHGIRQTQAAVAHHEETTSKGGTNGAVNTWHLPKESCTCSNSGCWHLCTFCFLDLSLIRKGRNWWLRHHSTQSVILVRCFQYPQARMYLQLWGLMVGTCSTVPDFTFHTSCKQPHRYETLCCNFGFKGFCLTIGLKSVSPSCLSWAWLNYNGWQNGNSTCGFVELSNIVRQGAALGPKLNLCDF